MKKLILWAQIERGQHLRCSLGFASENLLRNVSGHCSKKGRHGLSAVYGLIDQVDYDYVGLSLSCTERVEGIENAEEFLLFMIRYYFLLFHLTKIHSFFTFPLATVVSFLLQATNACMWLSSSYRESWMMEDRLQWRSYPIIGIRGRRNSCTRPRFWHVYITGILWIY